MTPLIWSPRNVRGTILLGGNIAGGWGGRDAAVADAHSISRFARGSGSWRGGRTHVQRGSIHAQRGCIRAQKG
eukprot:3419140-Pyramimonas_sp.AAC.1